MASLAMFSIVAAGLGRLTGVGVTEVDDTTVIAKRMLHIADRGDGAVILTEAGTNEIVRVVHPGKDGFLRGIFRSLTRERRLNGIGAEAPFALELQEDGRLTLADPATRQRIELVAFGQTNLSTFASLLSTRRTQQ